MLSLNHHVGTSLTLSRHGVPLFTLVYAGKPKPYLHPLSTPSGVVLTNFEPTDHVWHRGLWFTFKFVNGENFWEEPPPSTPDEAPTYGTLVAAAPPAVSHPAPDSCRIDLSLDWRRPNGDVVLREHRTLVYRPLSPTAYALDHHSRLTPVVDVLLDRTAFTTWGGYGGLCFRATRNWMNSNILLSTGQSTHRPVGLPARWAVLTGQLDGGPSLVGSLAILDHPANPRHPTPFYGAANASHHYLTPAPLFHEPLAVPAGQPLTLRYRVIPHEGLLTPAELDTLATDFATASL